MKFRYSRHAEEEMTRRGISRALTDEVLRRPQQVVLERGARKAYQAKVIFDDGRRFLLRLIVDDAVDPAVVITVYRTSKMDKYWRRK